MTKKRSIIIFWALFLVPTLITAGMAARLLWHEQERINQSAIAALSERAQAVCDSIHITIEAVQENLAQALLKIDSKNLKKNLFTWERTNPLVRNVFIYQQGRDLIYPVRGMESTLEERQFIDRYASLFSGELKFDFNAAVFQDETTKNIPQKSYREPASSRQKLVALSRMAQEAPASDRQAFFSAEPDRQLIKKKGWIPWFSGNRLHILGWVQKYENGPVYGVELELMTLLSRLVVDFPDLSEKEASLVMMDGNKNFLHQSGGWVPDAGEKPVETVSISNLLPHWQIAVFIKDKGLGANKGFLILSLLLLLTFITAIISGGVLLTRLTLQNMKDARQKTNFVSSVSHELKTPLTSIRMYAELLLSKRITDTDKIQTYLSVIVNESSRLTRLINTVLDFGKLEQGRKTYHLIPFEMDQLLDQIIRVHRMRIEEHGLEIIIQKQKGNFYVRTDPDAMEQVVLNLVDNALKYAGKGKFLKFVLKRAGAVVMLQICDDGPGIPTDKRKAVFKKFYRVDNSLTSQQPGSGLGLSIARQTLTDLKGDLVLEPVSGKGCCFTIRINKYEAG